MAYYAVSDKCNLSCPFCYANPKKSRRRYTGDTYLSKQIIDRLANINVGFLIMSGGEPLMREDLCELIEYAVKHGMGVGLTTNGVMIDPEKAAALKSSGVTYIHVSIESDEPQEHDSLRGHGTFRKTVEAIQHLRTAGFSSDQLYVAMTTLSVDGQKYNRFWSFAEELGATPSISFFQQVGRARLHEQEFSSGDRGCLEFLCARMRKMAESVGINSAEVESCDPAQTFTPHVKNACKMGRKILGVKERGEVVPCHLFFSMNGFGLGNILDESITENLLRFANSLPTVDTVEGCKDCDVRYFCGNGCWATSYWESGRFTRQKRYCDMFYNYWSSIVWNLGKPGALRLIYDALNHLSVTNDSNNHYHARGK
jgi:radical SAM protein with 4Fe4S-binding SPASM domain